MRWPPTRLRSGRSSRRSWAGRRRATSGASAAPTVDPGTVTVDINDGTVADGVTAHASELATGAGFQLGALGVIAGTRKGHEQATTEFHYSGDEAAAQQVQSAFGGIGKLVNDSSVKADHVLVLVGTDLTVPSGCAAPPVLASTPVHGRRPRSAAGEGEGPTGAVAGRRSPLHRSRRLGRSPDVRPSPGASLLSVAQAPARAAAVVGPSLTISALARRMSGSPRHVSTQRPAGFADHLDVCRPIQPEWRTQPTWTHPLSPVRRGIDQPNSPANFADAPARPIRPIQRGVDQPNLERSQLR